ncbi:hypothetical protein HH214_06900 [Mucilaginibacter robiniae]|uniref:Uncharacterized protein n=1 Tax=Mucilaginibacter robiniae TaxID=2728022 RepID=A0A7L5DZT5_9SPHI|nr:hypothetical protein [Mucilaginibacter robiniae]QJD95617.1 hypothetical protein HH214_06900 [Mucilaginibacter robiniae]
MSSTQGANETKYYVFLTLAIFVGMAGVFVRFLDEVWGHGFLFTSLSNIILIIGILMALRWVFIVLK